MWGVTLWAKIVYVCFQVLYALQVSSYFQKVLTTRIPKIPSCLIFTAACITDGLLIKEKIPMSLIFFTIYAIYPLFFFKDKFSKKLVHASIVYVGMFGCDNMAFLIVNQFRLANPDLSMVLSCSLYFVLVSGVFISVIYIFKPLRGVGFTKSSVFFMLIPFSQILLFALFDYVFVYKYQSQYEFWTYYESTGICIATIIAIGFCFIADGLAVKGFTENIKNSALKAELDFAERKNELNLAYYSSLEENELKTQKLRHDFVNILQSMETCMAETDSPEAKNLYKQLCGELESLRTEHYSANGFINVILSNKEKLCREKGITPEIRASVPKKIGIGEMDLCRAMVNLIDNAVNASAADEQNANKTVKINVFTESGFLFIKTENNGSSAPEPSDDKKNHGFGQKILTEIAGKYDGAYLLEKDGNTVRAMLSMRLGENAAP